MDKDRWQEVQSTLPQLPGCYKFYNEQNQLLYVGKAKNLKKRISSYFNKNVGNYKTRKLVAQISTIDFTITATEHDAFLLEKSLIKHYQPRYNIDLKDDKSFPYLVIKKEHYPRVFLTRRLLKDGSEYLGPFTSVGRVRDLLALVKNNIPLRTCNLNLTPRNIERGKFKVCLQYHLGNCKGPCEGLQTEADYNENLQQVRHILKGNLQEVLRFMKEEMMGFASQLQYEKAAIVKSKMEALQRYQSKSAVVNMRLGNMDVISVLLQEGKAIANYMMFSEGSIIASHTIEVLPKLDESKAEIMSNVLAELREVFQSNSTEVIASETFELWDDGLKITVPKAGDKKKLLEMSERNAALFAEEIRRRGTLQMGNTIAAAEVLQGLQDDLQLQELPVHIECFDNSNFQGAYPVAAMVCFKHGLPDKKNYRHFHIKTVEGINDFASMAEVVYRRYSRLLKEEKPLPQLVIIDGGKGQLSAAMSSIEQLGLVGKLTVIGLAKKEESIFFPKDTDPLQLPYDSPSHKLIRQIRDEVHRFGITFHRQQRSKGTFKNELEAIKGIGKQTATQLLQRFRSVQKIKGLTERELTGEIGASKARIVYAYFHHEE